MTNEDLPLEPIEPSSESKENSTNKDSVKSLFNLLNEQIQKIDHDGPVTAQKDIAENSTKATTEIQASVASSVPGEEPTLILKKFQQLDKQDGLHEPFHKDPLYLSMMADFQQGKWEKGLQQLEQLLETYPYENELIFLKKEMELRSNFDDAEIIYSKQIKRQKIRRLAIRLLIVAGVFLLSYGIIYSYFTWFQTRFDQIRQTIASEQQAIIINTKFNNAQQLLMAFRPNEALPLLEEIQSEDPNFPNINTAIQKAESLVIVETQYNTAMQKKEEGDFVGALSIFQEIESQYPNYRDVTLQSKEMQRQFSLDDLIEEADIAIQNGDWEKAILDYEQVRNRDSSYQPQEVEQRLYYSYLNAAQKLLFDQPDSLDALTKAQVYYSKALSLKPQDSIVIEELETARTTIGNRLFNKYIELAQQSLIGQPDSIEGLKKAEEFLKMASTIRPSDVLIARERYNAEQYLAAQADFQKKNWNSAITILQAIYEYSPNYAGGTARQTLYDAYILRGDFYKTSGSASAALEDYRKALSIAEITPENQLRLFEAQTKIGDILGIMNNYETAIYQYRAAMDSAQINQILLTDLELVNSINQADEYVRRNMYQAAYRMYQGLMKEIIQKFKTETHVIESGDYLTQLANLYKTTSSAILAANNLSDPSQLSIGERIIIPVLP